VLHPAACCTDSVMAASAGQRPPAAARGGSAKESWRATSLRSTFGPQCLAQLATGPSCGFGSSLREANARARARACRTSLHICHDPVQHRPCCAAH
jgi:hypothetical protein